MHPHLVVGARPGAASRSRLRTGLLAACVLISASALAGPASYSCTIAHHQWLEPAGHLAPARANSRVGKTFSVERQTGRITAAPDLRLHVPEAALTVLARGNKDNAFVLQARAPASGDGVNLTLLWVEEFADGPRKPFLVLMNGATLSGTCE